MRTRHIRAARVEACAAAAALLVTGQLLAPAAAPAALAVPGTAYRTYAAAFAVVPVPPHRAYADASGETLPVPLAAGSASLESAAAKAGEVGRKVAMSMIALGFAIASIVLAFRRDFKEAAGVFAIGIVAILLATPAGVNVLHATVNTLFGG